MKKILCIALMFSTLTMQAQEALPAALEAIPEAESQPAPEEQPMQEEAPITAPSFAVKKPESDLQNWIFAASAILTVTAGILLVSCYPGAKAD